MALPTGQISLSQVNTELGRSSTAAISLNDSGLRSLFGKSSGAISMNDGRGKSSAFAFTIASNVNNADLRTLALNAGWNGSSAVTATINSGVVVGSGSTASPALTISGSFPGGVNLINNGSIVGKGGTGGGGLWRFTSSCGTTTQTAVIPGSSGGLALSVSAGVTLTNNGTIGGGGGGGGHGQSSEQFIPPTGSRSCIGASIPGFAVSMPGSGGGGAGYGVGGPVNYVKQGYTTASGGTLSGGCTGVGLQANGYIGSDGGATTGGASGSAQLADNPCCNTKGGSGGAGGSLGAAGSTGAGRSGGSCTSPYIMWNQSAGGAAGAAVSGNSNITWAATGTRLGAIA